MQPSSVINRPSLELFIESSSLAIARIAPPAEVAEANQAFYSLTQNTLSQKKTISFIDLVAGNQRDEAKDMLNRLFKRESLPMPQHFELVLPNGNQVSISLYATLVETPEGPAAFMQIIDTTEQKNLELRFAHSQKMQAVGQLAGGVAHDFNNLLTAMIGFCDLLLMRHPAGDQSFADIMQIKQNANRAANLVRQLLAFSRRQTLQPKLLEISDVLAELGNLVRRLIGENIELKMVHGRDVGVIKADQGQLEQVVINLAVNARDAMKEGGTLTIQTSRMTVDGSYKLPRDFVAPAEEDLQLPEGEYVRVDIGDTGTGIPGHILQKIFEPFFSTKEVGSGTGLGLSTVYGIIKQTGGNIFVNSQQGVGTTFSIFFPVQQRSADDQAHSTTPEKESTHDLTGQCTILLVEDETPVRLFAARALRNKGYHVLEAGSAEAALDIMHKEGDQIELIVTDVIMPGMNGPTMVEKIHEQYPNMKVVFMSGYAEDVFVNSYGSERGFNFLAKPFTLKQLAGKVKEVAEEVN